MPAHACRLLHAGTEGEGVIGTGRMGNRVAAVAGSCSEEIGAGSAAHAKVCGVLLLHAELLQ